MRSLSLRLAVSFPTAIGRKSPKKMVGACIGEFWSDGYLNAPLVTIGCTNQSLMDMSGSVVIGVNYDLMEFNLHARDCSHPRNGKFTCQRHNFKPNIYMIKLISMQEDDLSTDLQFFRTLMVGINHPHDVIGTHLKSGFDQ